MLGKNIEGLELEEFILSISKHLVSQFQLDKSNQNIIQMEIMKIARLYLNGFGDNFILSSLEKSIIPENKRTVIIEEIKETINYVELEDLQTNQFFKVKPRTNQFNELVRYMDSYFMTDMSQINSGIGAFIQGDYKKCIESATIGAKMFGKHLYYQLLIISYCRLDNNEKAEEVLRLGTTALQFSSFQVIALSISAGLADAETIISKFRNELSDSQIYQLKCYQGLRENTTGNKEEAIEILTYCNSVDSSLIEKVIVGAELERLERKTNIVAKKEETNTKKGNWWNPFN